MTDDLTTTTTATTTTRPHVRAGSIAWGLIVITIASLVWWVAVDSDRRSTLTDWGLSLTPGGAILVAVLVLGAVLLLTGVLAAIRRAQRVHAAKS